MFSADVLVSLHSYQRENCHIGYSQESGIKMPEESDMLGVDIEPSLTFMLDVL